MSEIIIDRIFLKESNIETPDSPAVFDKLVQENGEVSTDFSCNSSYGEHIINGIDVHEVNLTINIAATNRKSTGPNTADYLHLYILNFVYAGMFRLNDFKNETEKEEALAIDCPHIIFPYVRQYVSSLTGLTDLPATLLQEIYFKKLYYKSIGKEYK